MEAVFINTVLAVIVGNMVTLAVVASLRSIKKSDDAGEYPTYTALAGIIVPSLCVIGWLYPML